jgi:ribosomal protein S18 acetylase RimI-like enzyme
MPVETPSFTIRPCQPSDREAVLEIALRMGEDLLPPWRDRAKALEWERQEALQIVAPAQPGAEVFIAAGPDGTVLGFLYLYEQADFLTGVAQGYIADFAVSHAAEGQGIGRALMIAAEKHCRDKGYPTLALDVFATNHRAREFYERGGFQMETIKYVKILGAE